MTKEFCDKCGQEIKGDSYDVSIIRHDPMDKTGEFHTDFKGKFCEKCLEGIKNSIITNQDYEERDNEKNILPICPTT